ncbi:MAG: hypothetical protein IT305_10400 [Chloroflexi bacterium]|nr:hypothetical protein [Chloroflexota bacterium]
MLLRSTSAGATSLLVVLVFHLAYMASPLHAMTVEPQLDGREMAHADDDGGMVDAAQSDAHGRDCSIEWAKSAQTAWLISPLALPVSSISVLLADQMPMPPTAQAIGPPKRGDPQALLQVFRI